MLTSISVMADFSIGSVRFLKSLYIISVLNFGQNIVAYLLEARNCAPRETAFARQCPHATREELLRYEM
jgi:hypothetical protein